MKIILDLKDGSYTRFINALSAYAKAEDEYSNTPTTEDMYEVLDDRENSMHLAASDVLDVLWGALPEHIVDEVESGDLF